MQVHYYCRHCASSIGSLEGEVFTEEQLGLHLLTEEEKEEMISYGGNGDIYIQSICEHCHQVLIENPEFHQYDHLIH